MAQASAALNKAVALKPDLAEAHLNLGGLYTSMNRLNDAEEEYETAASLKPNMAEAHYSLGLFYELHRKDLTRALAQ